MKITVKDCNDCKFKAVTYNTIICHHPKYLHGKYIIKTIKKIIPDWCPLKKESITIELEK